MAWEQLRDANMSIGYVGGWCLKYVQDAFGTDHPYPTAIAEWNATSTHNHPNEEPPLGITVPIYLSLGNVPAGHVAIRLSDGYVASSTQAGSHSSPYYHKSIADLVSVYGQYNGGAQYLGWSEVVGTTQVVQYSNPNATDDQIRQDYLDILERPADDSGLTHYRNYTNDFVRADLQASNEYKALQTNKANQAAMAQAAQDALVKAAADKAAEQKAAADAKATADALAATQAQAETDARQKALEAQTTPDAAIAHIQNAVDENNSLLKRIWAAVQVILDKITGVFK
jgi:hypothetical protein